MRSPTLLAAVALAVTAASPRPPRSVTSRRRGARRRAWPGSARRGAAGYPEGQAPRIDDPATYPFAVVSVRDSTPIHRAGKRLRALGVAKRLTQLWTGELGGVFEGIDISPLLEPVG